MKMKLFVKIDGVWHVANVSETATVCGLDPVNVDDTRKSLQSPLGAYCKECAGEAPHGSWLSPGNRYR